MDAGGGGAAGDLVPAVDDVDGGVQDQDGGGWTDPTTEAMLGIAVRLLRYALPSGEMKFNRQGFWEEVSGSLMEEAKVARTARCCEGRYKGVMEYYRRKRGKLLGRDYRFAGVLEEAIPLDDQLQPTRRTVKKKSSKASNSNSKKRPSTEAADGVVEGPQPPAKRAATAGVAAAADDAAAAGADKLVQMVSQLMAQFQAWQEKDEQWKANMTSMIQGLLNAPQPPTNLLPLDPIFPGANDFVYHSFP